MRAVQDLSKQIKSLGLKDGDIVMVHSSYKALGITDPEWIIEALLQVIGESGTLLMPALSYMQTPHNIHNTLTTPTCIGYLTEYFRKRPGTRRSLHPTHSVCGIGLRTAELLDDHSRDNTPCGEHSPFNKILHNRGKILMLGCGLRPNTTMHAIEEHARPPYLFGDPLVYTLTDAAGRTFDKEYITHDFKGWDQRYDRVKQVLDPHDLAEGMVGKATSYLMNCNALFTYALEAYQQNPLFFVDPWQEKEDE